MKLIVLMLLAGLPLACDSKDAGSRPHNKDDKWGHEKQADARASAPGDNKGDMKADASAYGDRYRFEAGQPTVVKVSKRWRHVLGEMETEETVIELYLGKIKDALENHAGSRWKPSIDYGRPSVVLGWEDSLQPSTGDRRVYEGKIRLSLGESQQAGVVRIVAETSVRVTDIRGGLPRYVDDEEAADLEREIQDVLRMIE